MYVDHHITEDTIELGETRYECVKVVRFSGDKPIKDIRNGKKIAEYMIQDDPLTRGRRIFPNDGNE